MKQRTFKVAGVRYRIQATRSSTRNGNYNGYIVRVNNETYRIRTLCSIEEAMGAAYTTYVKEHC